MPSRTGPCPCGSGKKYKHCCEPKDIARQKKKRRRVTALFASLFVIVGAVIAAGYWRHVTASPLAELGKCVAKKGVVMYRSYRCPYCQEQDDLLGPGARFIPHIDCEKPGLSGLTEACKKAGVSSWPTWEHPEAGRKTEVLSPVQLAHFAGCPFEDYVPEPPKEKTQDLKALASCLKEKGFTFYGAHWCSHCENQKRMFGEAATALPYHECSEPDSRKMTQDCQEKGIKTFPTWEGPDGKRREGTRKLEELAEWSGCPLEATAGGEGEAKTKRPPAAPAQPDGEAKTETDRTTGATP